MYWQYLFLRLPDHDVVTPLPEGATGAGPPGSLYPEPGGRCPSGSAFLSARSATAGRQTNIRDLRPMGPPRPSRRKARDLPTYLGSRLGEIPRLFEDP